jgi:hypothetical protein
MHTPHSLVAPLPLANTLCGVAPIAVRVITPQLGDFAHPILSWVPADVSAETIGYIVDRYADHALADIGRLWYAPVNI